MSFISHSCIVRFESFRAEKVKVSSAKKFVAGVKRVFTVSLRAFW